MSETVVVTPKGSPGRGVPRGGNTTQVLAKLSGEDFDTGWVDQTGGGGGSGTEFIMVALSDELTPLTVGDPKVTIRVPYPLTALVFRTSLTSESDDGPVTVTVAQDGVSILSTPITIDEGSTTSVGATVPPVISNPDLEDDGRLTFGISAAGTNATGLKLTIIVQKP